MIIKMQEMAKDKSSNLTPRFCNGNENHHSAPGGAEENSNKMINTVRECYDHIENVLKFFETVKDGKFDCYLSKMKTDNINTFNNMRLVILELLVKEE